MKAKRLLFSIGTIDDKFIEEAAPRERITTLPKHARTHIWRFASLAACGAIVVTALLTFGRNGLSPIPPNNGILPPTQTEQSSNPGEQTPLETPKLYPLTLNKTDVSMSASIRIPGQFWYELTDQQLKAVFPNLPLTISAAAHYSGDGSLFNVMAYEASTDGETLMFNEYYIQTEIQIAPGEILEDVIYEYEVQTSDVYGVPVVAGVFDGIENDGVALYIASFKREGASYYIKLHDSDEGENGPKRLTELVNTLIRNGAADLSVLSNPVIPELRDEQLTLDKARSDPDFGFYLPGSVPARFQLDSARRFINQQTDGLFVHWSVGYDYIDWRVSQATDYDHEHIVSAKDQEKYDMSLYTIPLADSVPEELREYVDNPVFLAEELTLDVVRARAYQVDDRGDTPGPRMNFGVLYGDVVVSVSIKGVLSEDVWNMLSELAKR